jgi:hypothetical protein
MLYQNVYWNDYLLLKDLNPESSHKSNRLILKLITELLMISKVTENGMTKLLQEFREKSEYLLKSLSCMRLWTHCKLSSLYYKIDETDKKLGRIIEEPLKIKLRKFSIKLYICWIIYLVFIYITSDCFFFIHIHIVKYSSTY